MFPTKVQKCTIHAEKEQGREILEGIEGAITDFEKKTQVFFRNIAVMNMDIETPPYDPRENLRLTFAASMVDLGEVRETPTSGYCSVCEKLGKKKKKVKSGRTCTICNDLTCKDHVAKIVCSSCVERQTIC